MILTEIVRTVTGRDGPGRHPRSATVWTGYGWSKKIFPWTP